MRVVQLIDSLEAGGAERMAVNIANGLLSEFSFSALVTTRKEGALKKSLHKKVVYLFLKKKSTLDIQSILKLRSFLIENKIDIVHAHGTSYFYAVLVKLIYPKIKIIFHDHNGNRINLKKSNAILKLFSFLFSAVFTVNEALQKWAQKELSCKMVCFIPNFAVENYSEIATTLLKGASGKRIICLANLRNPKNHITLLKSFYASDAKQNGWTLHLIGTDNGDTYSSILKQFVKENDMEHAVFFYGSCNDVGLILKQGNIGVLSSTYEGFPVTLLEYGLSKLAVISSNVGYCKTVIEHETTGLLFDPEKQDALTNCLNVLINNTYLSEKLANNLHTFVLSNYSETIIVKKIIQVYTKVL